MMSRNSGAMVRRFTLLPLLAATLVAVPAGAQSSGGGGTVRARRDTVVTVRLRASEEAQVSRLRAILDSLMSKVRAEPLSLSERAAVEERLSSVMVALESLRRAEIEAMASASPGARARLQRNQVERVQLEVMGSETAPRVTPFRGWIGITAEGAQFKTAFKNGEVFLRYVDYPEIISVEPNSPAERVGIAKGDVLVAYDGQDVRDGDINISRLLVPDRRLRVTVNRDGDRREYAMVVAEAPQHLVARRTEFGLLEPSGTLMPSRARTATGATGAGGAAGGVTVAPRGNAQAGPRAPTRTEVFVMPDPASAGGYSFRAFSGIGGANASTVEGTLGDYFGVEYGVLLTGVREDTPAFRAGLLSGDVIVKADGRVTRTLPALQRILNERGNETVELSVVRKGKNITVVWEPAR